MSAIGNPKLNIFMQLAGAALAVSAVIFLLSHFDLLPRTASIGESTSYGVVFLIGLLASVSTCIAVTGGLLVALAAKYNEQAGHLSGKARFKTHLYFNAGRIASYTAFGALIGAAGSALTLAPAVYGAVTIAASALMFVVGLQMLGLMTD